MLDVDGVKVGTLICQDDNFVDIARAYARAGAGLLVVPSFEGPSSVAPYHFENSRLRSIENSVALVRATAQGQSAAFAPGGFLVASRDGMLAGVGVLMTDVPIRSEGHL
jgi:apolipoprotein N-acyltransferase